MLGCLECEQGLERKRCSPGGKRGVSEIFKANWGEEEGQFTRNLSAGNRVLRGIPGTAAPVAVKSTAAGMGCVLPGSRGGCTWARGPRVRVPSSVSPGACPQCMSRGPCPQRVAAGACPAGACPAVRVPGCVSPARGRGWAHSGSSTRAHSTSCFASVKI